MLLWPERQPWALQGWALLRAGLGLGFPHLQVTGVLCPARAAPSEPGPGAREQALWGQNDLLALAVGPEAPEQETPQNRGRGRGGVRGSPACASPGGGVLSSILYQKIPVSSLSVIELTTEGRANWKRIIFQEPRKHPDHGNGYQES